MDVRRAEASGFDFEFREVNYYDERICQAKASRRRWYRRLFGVRALHLVWQFEALFEPTARPKD